MQQIILLWVLVFTCDAYAGSQWGVGVGAIIQNEGYVQADTRTRVIPFVTYRSARFYLQGPQLGYTLYRGAQGLSLTAIGQFRFDGFDKHDSDFFTGMQERYPAFDVGMELDYRAAAGTLSGYYMVDVTGTHKGKEFGVRFAYPIAVSRQLRITPSLSAARLSEDLVDYYYGIRTDEITVGRPFYQGEQTTNVTFSVNTLWRLSAEHSVVGTLNYTRFGDRITASPLIEDSAGIGVLVGYIYQF